MHNSARYQETVLTAVNVKHVYSDKILYHNCRVKSRQIENVVQTLIRTDVCRIAQCPVASFRKILASYVQNIRFENIRLCCNN